MVSPATRPRGGPDGAVAPVLALVGALRAGGLSVSTGETLDAVRAVAAVDPANRTVVREALRVTLVKDGAHDDIFERAFAAIFPAASHRTAVKRQASGSAIDPATAADACGRSPDLTRLPDPTSELADAVVAGDHGAMAELLEAAIERWGAVDAGRSAEYHVRRVLRAMDLSALHRRVLELASDAPDPLQRRLAPIEAGQAVEELRRRLEELVRGRLHDLHGRDDGRRARNDLEDRPILRAGPDELTALRSAVRPLARRLAARLGRRRRRRRGHLDMRRTVRRSLQYGGVPVDPALRRRHPVRPDLVVLCDVSGSIAQFAPFTLALLHALHREFSYVRSYVFVDGVMEVSGFLDSAPGVLDPRHLLDRRGLVAGDGRSDYARAFTSFLASWPDVVSPRSTVIIVGDGRSHDRPDAVPQVRELARAARRLYWLDPEPRAEWATGDSRMPDYAMHCTAVFQVATLRQLADAVAAIA